MDAAMAILLLIVTHWTIQSLAALIMLDVVTGIAAAWKTGEFELQRMADFLSSNVGPYLLCYGAVRLAMLALPEWEPVATGIWALIVAALAGSIATNLRRVFGTELPIPGTD